MTDPLAEVVSLLQPDARLSKVSSGAGRWHVRRAEHGQPFYCVILDGSCRLVIDGREPLVVQEGDFVLIPSAHGFTVTSLDPPEPGTAQAVPVQRDDGEYRLGDTDVPAEVRMMVGHCVFGSPDAALLVSLLPELVHVRGEWRLATLRAPPGRRVSRATSGPRRDPRRGFSKCSSSRPCDPRRARPHRPDSCAASPIRASPPPSG